MHGLNDVHGSQQTDHITSKTDGLITRQIDGKTRTFKPSLMSRVKSLAQALRSRFLGASSPKDQLSEGTIEIQGPSSVKVHPMPSEVSSVTRLPDKDTFNGLGLSEKMSLMSSETATRLSQSTKASSRERLNRRLDNFKVMDSLVKSGDVIGLTVSKGWVGESSVRDGHTSQFHELTLTFKDAHTEKFQPDSTIEMQRSGVLAHSLNTFATPEQRMQLSFHGVREFTDGSAQRVFHYQDRQMSESEFRAFATTLAKPQVSSGIELTDFSDDFKAVVAQKKLLTELSAAELKTIGDQMNQYFEANGVSDLRNSISLRDEQLASAWMMKLSFNRGLSDRQFLTYMARGEQIFKGEPQTPLQMATSENNDIPAIAWYLKGVSGQQLFEKGATRVHLPNQKTWALFNELQPHMKERISTHFGGTKLTEKGYGKDIPNESLRDHMPFQFGALLMYPTSHDASEDMFALKLSQSRASSMTPDSIASLYRDVFNADIPPELSAALMANQAQLTSKLSVFRVANLVNSATFNIDIGIKLEDFGHGDTRYHTAVYSKYGKPLAALKKKIWNIGSKKTAIKTSFSTSIAGDTVKMAAHKEHMSTLPREAQQLALQLADLLPEFKRGTKTRIDFSLKSLQRGMQEDTVQMKTGQTNWRGRDRGVTTSIQYLMDRVELSKDPAVRPIREQLTAILEPLKAQQAMGLEGQEEQLEIGAFFNTFQQDLDPSHPEGAREHYQTNRGDANRLAPYLHLSNGSGPPRPLGDSDQMDEAYSKSCFSNLLNACQSLDPAGTDRLRVAFDASDDVSNFFSSIPTDDRSLFVQVMKGWNQRTTGLYYDAIAKNYMQMGYSVSDRNESNQSQKVYKVSIEPQGVVVTQTIRYFLRPFDDPSQVNGSFDVTFNTMIDPETHAVVGTQASMGNPSDGLPLQGAMTQLMNRFSS